MVTYSSPLPAFSHHFPASHPKEDVYLAAEIQSVDGLSRFLVVSPPGRSEEAERRAEEGRLAVSSRS